VLVQLERELSDITCGAPAKSYIVFNSPRRTLYVDYRKRNSSSTRGARILEFAYVLNAGTVHKGAHFLISLFLPPYMLFLAFFFAKLESTTLIWRWGPYSKQSLNGKGEFDF
jgi:hypothetical protein